MKLCTDKVVADWLALTQKRVKQLRDEGVLIEKSPGLYDLRASVLRYVNYIRTGNRADLNGADMENEVRRGTLHSSEDIEKGIKTMCLNIRGRFLTLPAKLAPKLAELGGNQAAIFDELNQAMKEALEGLSNYNVAMAMPDGGDDEEAEESV